MPPFLYFKVIKPLVASSGGRFITAISAWALMWLIAYGDILYIAWQAKKLCRAEAGPHVYRTAQADGFLGDPSILYWTPYGFTYVESRRAGGKIKRKTLSNGKINEELVSESISQYELARDSQLAATQIMRDRKMVRDRKTGEVLGEYVSLAIFPGWIDSKFLSATGLTFSAPRCTSPRQPPKSGAGYDSQAFVKSILKPLQNPVGASQ